MNVFAAMAVSSADRFRGAIWGQLGGDAISVSRKLLDGRHRAT